MTTEQNVQTILETLARLVGQSETERFLHHHWGQRPLHVAREDGTYFRDLFSPQDLDKAIGYSISRDNVSFIKNGEIEPLSVKGNMKSLTEIYAGFCQGASLLVRNIHRRCRPIGEFTNALSIELGFNVDADVQAYPAGYATGKVRSAESECFLLQISGECFWDFDDPDLMESPCQTQPGDTLYLPRGTSFATRCQVGVAICLVIHIRAKTMRDLLYRAISQMAEKDVTFRRNLPFGMPILKDSQNAIAPYLNEHILSKLKDLDFESSRARLSRQIKRDMPPLPDGHFTQICQVDAIDAETELERRPGMTGEMSFVENGVLFDFPGHSLKSPEKMFLAIEFLKTHPRFKVGDISGWFTTEEKIVWAQHLVRNGYLRIV